MNRECHIKDNSAPWDTLSIEDVNEMSQLELYLLEHQLEVCSIPKSAIRDLTYPIIKIALLPDSSPDFFSFTETCEDYTIIVTKENFEDIPKHDKLVKSSDSWRALAVSVGEMGATELAGVSRIARNAICPLADKGISVLVLSTYQSDYILVQEPVLSDAVECLAAHFNVYNENGGLILSPEGNVSSDRKFFDDLVKSRPDVTSIVSPESYHIAGLNAALFPSVLQVLLELMFYSSKAKSDNFFHYSMIEGDISLILDSHALSRFPSNALLTSSDSDTWRMINIGDVPFDFETYGVVARVAEPLAQAGLSTYYISTYNYGHTLVTNEDLDHVLRILNEHRANSSEESR